MKVGVSPPAHRRKRAGSGWRIYAVFVLAALHFVLVGCATWKMPQQADNAVLRARAVSAAQQGVRLSAAVLSAEDSRRLFGADVNGKGVQPVWVEVENRTAQTLWLLRSGADPDYFSPLEVAWSFHVPLAGATNARIDAHFDALAFANPIPPESTRDGVIFTNPHRRTRLLNIDLLGHRQLIPFTLFPPVPDDAPHEQIHEILARYMDDQVIVYGDANEFRAALERLPCCAMGEDGTTSGDPMNMVLVGELDDIGAVLVRRGFRRDAIDSDTAQRLFGRLPDIVARKGGQGGVPANWLRLWLAPLRFRGQPVFLVQAGRPVGGRFAVGEGKDLVLHADVDEARNLVIQDLLYSGGLAKLGFVDGVGVATLAQPRQSLAGTSYYTDGLRAVLFLATRPLEISDVQILDWVSYLDYRAAATSEEKASEPQ